MMFELITILNNNETIGFIEICQFVEVSMKNIMIIGSKICELFLDKILAGYTHVGSNLMPSLIVVDNQIDAQPPLDIPETGDLSGTVAEINNKASYYIQVKSTFSDWTGKISIFTNPEAEFWRKFVRQMGYTMNYLGEFHKFSGPRGYAIFVEWNSKLGIIFSFPSRNLPTNIEFTALAFNQLDSWNHEHIYIQHVMDVVKRDSLILSQVPRSKLFWMQPSL